MKSLKGQLALVTGAAMGMGRSLSELLLDEGCDVAMVDINEKELAITIKQLQAKGNCKSYMCDVSKRDAVYTLQKKVKKEMGDVTILVNNAGVVKVGSFLNLEDKSIEWIVNVNLMSIFWMCKAFMPDMIHKPWAHVVNFASAAGLLSLPDISIYCATKFAVVGFSDALRQEMKKYKYNVGITMVCPYTVATGMFQGFKEVAGTKILKTEDVTTKVIKAIKKNKAMVAVPNFQVNFLTPLTKLLLPVHTMDMLNKLVGMWTANEHTVGRQGKQR
ncbi:MAG: SDR family NAD(P)-dependent oxidoreductase [Spirochaetota bacterium]